MKKLSALLLVLTMILSSAVFVSAETKSLSNFIKVQEFKSGTFKDIDETGWYMDNIKAAYELGLMKGSTDGNFNPDGDITVIETIALAARVHKIYNTGNGDFVQGTPWYQIYVDYAVANGIIADGEYSDLMAKATREQFAYILAKAVPAEELNAKNTVEEDAIPDVASDSKYKDPIYMLYRAGVITGNDEKGTFTPKSNIGRSSVAALVTRIVDKSLRKSIKLSASNSSCISKDNTAESSAADDSIYKDYGPIIEKGLSASSAATSSPASITDKYTFKDIAYYLGVSSKVKYTVNSPTEQEFKDSIMYNAVIGNYMPVFNLDEKTKNLFFDTDCAYQWMHSIALALPELLGTYSNVSLYNSYTGSNPCVFFIHPAIEALTQQQIYNRQIKSISTALEINKSLRSEGKLKDSMTEMEKAKVFADYLKSLDMDPSMGGSCADHENMYYDSAFSGLVQQVAACGGRAASYNMLLRTENIACSAIGCTVKENGGGHYINRMVLDGKEYFYDWYNECWFPKIMTKSEVEQVVTFYDGQYEFTGEVIKAWQEDNQ